MGRMLDALKRADSTRGQTDERPPAPPMADDSMEPEPILCLDEEIPFIEVGPHKSMEASPSVLACSPVVSPHSPRFDPPAAPSSEPLGGVPPPRSVHFRALPSRAEERSPFAPELLAYHAPEQPAARQYREVLDAVLNASAASERAASLLFAPALPRTLATTTLLNVAITAARQGRRRVIVVDANPRRPGVAELLGLPAAPGLREALAGTAALDEIVQATEQANLFALTAGSPPPNAGHGLRFVTETMRSLLRQLRSRYPLVFVDGPHWDGQHEATVLGAACDAMFLVVDERESETPQIDDLMQQIPNQGARLVGCILVAGQV